MLSGSGAPGGGTGANGDLHLDLSNSVLQGPKTAGVWPAPGTSLIGPTGAAGATGSAGATGPIGPTGPVGGLNPPRVLDIVAAGQTATLRVTMPIGRHNELKRGEVSGTVTFTVTVSSSNGTRTTDNIRTGLRR